MKKLIIFESILIIFFVLAWSFSRSEETPVTVTNEYCDYVLEELELTKTELEQNYYLQKWALRDLDIFSSNMYGETVNAKRFNEKMRDYEKRVFELSMTFKNEC